MFTVMSGHVDQFGCLANGQKCSLGDRFRLADEGDDRAVRALSGVHVQQPHSPYRFYGIGDLPDDGQVAALREVGHALDDPVHV